MLKPVKRNIVWLASYPKSGNTWFRAFLTALLSDEQELDINNLWINYHFNDSRLFEAICELNPSELYLEEIDELKPEVFKYLSSQQKDIIYIKIHEYFRILNKSKFIIPTEASLISLYFIRNPLDIVVSLAHHENCSISESIERIQKNIILSKIDKNAEFFNIPEQIGSWKQHVASWTNCCPIKTEIIRYEDMYYSPFKTFQRAVKAIGLTFDEKAIRKAIQKASFQNLKKQEKKKLFVEKNALAKNFFRKGKPDSWKTELSPNQVKQVIENNEVLMKKFGYL